VVPEGWLYQAEQVLARENHPLRTVWSLLAKDHLDQARQALRNLGPEVNRSEVGVPGAIASVTKALARGYVRQALQSRDQGKDIALVVTGLETALGIDPNCLPALVYSAWLKATCPQPEIRDGKAAVALAQKACDLTKWTDNRCLTALAAGSAESGDFPRAVQFQQRACELHAPGLCAGRKKEMEARLASYAAREHIHQEWLKPLIGWWKLDEARGNLVHDSSGGDSPGKIVGNPAWRAGGGRIGGALEFDGDGDGIEIANESSFDLVDQITLAAWVKIRTVSSEYMTIISKGDKAWRLSLSPWSCGVHFATGATAPYDMSHDCIFGLTEVPLGQWTHICGTYDGAYLRLYVNGVEDPGSPAERTGGIATNDAAVTIGENLDKPGRSWNGLLDDVRIYSCALSPREVKALFESAGDKRENGAKR